MAHKFNDLGELLAGDAGARAFYKALPDTLKDQMAQRAQGINSFESLRDYVDNLVQE